MLANNCSRTQKKMLTRAVTSVAQEEQDRLLQLPRWFQVEREVSVLNRWRDALDPSIAPTAGRVRDGQKTKTEAVQGAVQMHGGKDWSAIAALVRVEREVRRDGGCLDPSTNPTTDVQRKKTKTEAAGCVRAHGGKRLVYCCAGSGSNEKSVLEQMA
jgi:hypothetical protein